MKGSFKKTIRLETCIYQDEEMGSRGMKVWLMFDAVGGMNLHRNYVAELSAVPSCTMKWFN